MRCERIGDCVLYQGDCLEVLPTLEAVDCIVTDPPYGLEFMGKEWDRLWTKRNGKESRGRGRDPFTSAQVEKYVGGTTAQAWHQQWAIAALRVLKPGGYMLAFGGTRTYHRLACAVEDAGFEVRDCIMWIYGSGFPKGKGCLKPAYEPILLCRKPGAKVLPLGIEDCRVAHAEECKVMAAQTDPKVMSGNGKYRQAGRHKPTLELKPSGRWPANVCHDGSEEVMEAFAAFGERTSGSGNKGKGRSVNCYGQFGKIDWWDEGSTGTAARFFYTAKASRKERGEGNNHPTVKPLKLMEWLVKLVCPPGGVVLDPFAGSGTTGVACHRTGRRFIGVEKSAEYFDIKVNRIRAEYANEPELFAV